MTRIVSTVPEWDAFIHDANEHGVVAHAGGPILDLLRYWADTTDPIELVATIRPNDEVARPIVYSLDIKTSERTLNWSAIDGPLTWREVDTCGMFAGRLTWRDPYWPREMRETSYRLHMAVADTGAAA
ncbi:hypothetical protein [Nocardia niwae]|uniref:hypothetical protein n=1 Tax=Nocardia niwae TaxID=626084 RepID=UPI0007A48AC6|nr:hypothetical protein [Nocardia niwae]